MKKINVGDRVKMVRPSSYTFDKVGNTGTVVELDKGYVTVSVDGQGKPTIGDAWHYLESAESWELLKEESKMTKFKVGDKVVIKDNESHHEFQNGDVVVITMVGRGTYRGHKVGDDPAGWWAFGDREIEEYKEEVKVQKFKVGDKVRLVKKYLYSFEKIGMVGEVVKDSGYSTLSITIKDSGDPEFWWTYPAHDGNWELVQNEKPKATVLKLGDYKIVFNGDTTVVTDGVGKGVAKRHPDDEYDAVVGLQVAIERFNGGTRKPKIGDKVRVLKVDGNSRYGGHCYDIGDIVTVTGFAHYYANTDICCKDRYGFKQTLTASEYEVLG